MVAKCDSGDLTAENNCVDILLLSLKAFVMVQAFAFVFPCVYHSETCPRLSGEEKGGETIPAQSWETLGLSCNNSERRGRTAPMGPCALSWASCGFTDIFNSNKVVCCRGDGLLLTCCFPSGDEVSQPPVPAQWGAVISGHTYCRAPRSVHVICWT